MTDQEAPARPGTIWIVGTPIGNLEDVTLRALRVLREADVIAAEDTRHTRKLLAHYDIHTPLTSFYQHRQFRQAPALIGRVLAGATLALVTDAGTPGISDPGAHLVRLALDAGIEVAPVPGPCAAIALLCVSGLATDSFVFQGFLPVKAGRKRRLLEELAGERRTLVFYESPHRIAKTLALMLEVLGDRPAAAGRELTKVFEEISRDSLGRILERYRDRVVRGEVTLAVAGASGGAARAPDGTDEEEGRCDEPPWDTDAPPPDPDTE